MKTYQKPTVEICPVAGSPIVTLSDESGLIPMDEDDSSDPDDMTEQTEQ